MGKTAIYEPAITQLVTEGRDKVTELRDAEEACRKLEKKLGEGREAAQMRRLELGKLLNKVRAMYPRRGTAEAGWKAYLEAIEIDDSTAYRYMEMAKAPPASSAATSQTADVRRSEGADQPDAPPPLDADAPREADDQATEADVEIDRDTWCTPKWITDALGKVDLDPCANDRSHVQAKVEFLLERGEDGLVLAAGIGKSWRVFINPPYSDVGPWIRAYAHTRFCFLLKLDPSTKWFKELFAMTELILIPIGTRVQFEPPPGVPADQAKAQPFPHALFFAKAEDVTPELLERCFVWRVERT